MSKHPVCVASHIESAPIERIRLQSMSDVCGMLDGRSRPFIATGCLDQWEALRGWTPAHMAERFRQVAVAASVNLPAEGAPYALPPAPHQRETTIGAFVDQMESADKPCYLHQVALERLPGLAREVDFGALKLRWNDSLRLYLWLGSAGTRSGLHFDRFDNINAQVFGRKHVVLASPEQSSLVYPFADNVEKSQVDPDHPDFHQFPRLKRLRTLTAVLEPGELLFIPRLWWHHFRSLETAINVNCWYGPHIPLSAILRVVRQGGPACWAQVVRDFVRCGVLGGSANSRLFSEPPTGKFLFDLASGALRRRLPSGWGR